MVQGTPKLGFFWMAHFSDRMQGTGSSVPVSWRVRRSCCWDVCCVRAPHLPVGGLGVKTWKNEAVKFGEMSLPQGNDQFTY